MTTNKPKKGPGKVEWDEKLEDGRTIHIAYEEADDRDGEENQQRLDRAFDILFDEVLRRRKEREDA